MTAGSPNEGDGLVGRMIAGKLEVLERLGSGSMGHVYRAHHHGLDKDVAIKVLKENTSNDPQSSERFATEAKAASRLSHPNSVAILDFGEDGQDNLLYIAMELVRGENLQQVIDRGTLLAVERICSVMTQVLAALAAAHDANVIHRDMKPSNIVLVQQRNDDGEMVERVKVCDFGVAKLSESARSSRKGTDAARVVGTPLYMSPEQATGEPLDPRTDVYSCGVIMYEMLTGQPPFQAETPMAVLMKHVSEALTPPSALVPGVPVELEALILWALEKRRELRPASAREFRTALRAYLAGKTHTIEALGKYGVRVEVNADPWSGPTPYHMVMPTASHSLLAAPPLPPLPEILPPSTGRPTPGGTPWPNLESFPNEDSNVDRRLDTLFGNTSYFETKGRKPIDTNEIYLHPPITKQNKPTSSGIGSRAPTSNHYLSERFGLSLERSVPTEGFWFRDTLSREIGPLTWSELTHVLRVESSVSPSHAQGSSISTEPSGAWTTTRRFIDAMGVEPLLWEGRPQPPSAFSGNLKDRSLTWLLGHLSLNERTGVLGISVQSERRKAEFRLHFRDGHLLEIESNEPHLQSLSILTAKGLISPTSALQCSRSVLNRKLSLMDALEEMDGFEGESLEGIRQERLRQLLRWPKGEYALISNAPKESSVFPLYLASALPDLIYRAVPRELLMEALHPVLNSPMTPTANARILLRQMKLTASQLQLAHRILGSTQLAKVLPQQGKLRKAFTTMAYVLWQLEITRLRPQT